MLSIEKCRQLIPEAERLSDEEIIQDRDALFDLGQLAFEKWKSHQSDPDDP